MNCSEWRITGPDGTISHCQAALGQETCWKRRRALTSRRKRCFEQGHEKSSSINRVSCNIRSLKVPELVMIEVSVDSNCVDHLGCTNRCCSRLKLRQVERVNDRLREGPIDAADRGQQITASNRTSIENQSKISEFTNHLPDKQLMYTIKHCARKHTYVINEQGRRRL